MIASFAIALFGELTDLPELSLSGVREIGVKHLTVDTIHILYSTVAADAVLSGHITFGSVSPE